MTPRACTWSLNKPGSGPVTLFGICCFMLGGLASPSFAAVVEEEDSARGEIEVNPIVNGAPQRQGCTVNVYGAGSQGVDRPQAEGMLATGEAGVRVSLEPGRYDLAVVCNTERITMQAFVPEVVVKPRKPLIVPVVMDSGALVVHGMRGGTRVKAEVAILFPGTTYEVARGQAGNRVELATGVYDVRLSAEIGGEISVVTLERQKVVAGPPQIIQIDLSPGQLIVVVNRNGKLAPGIAAMTAPGATHRIREFNAGEPVDVAAGVYDVLGALTDSFDFVEKRQRRVTVLPGKVNRVQIDIPRGSVPTRCELDGQEVPGRVFGYLPGAEDYFNAAACGEKLELGPGKYHFKFVLDVTRTRYDVLGGGNPEQWHRNVVVDKGKDRKIVADFSPAELTVVASKNGEFLSTDVAVKQWGLRGPALLGTGTSGEVMRVPPGTYDVEVEFPVPSRGEAPTEVVRGITCEARRACYAEMNLERATIVIEVYRQGAPFSAAEVLLFKSGSTEPYVQGLSGDPLEVPPGDWIPEVRSGESKRQLSKMRVRAGTHEQRQVEIE